MWLKEENNKLIPPPVNYRTPNGATICNFHLNPEAMIRYGWRDWTKEEYDAWHQAHPAPVIPRTMCTKYELVTCLQNHFPELLQSLMDTYAVTPNLQFYWNSVLDLDRNNTDFQNLVSRLEITEAQLDAIFAKIGA